MNKIEDLLNLNVRNRLTIGDRDKILGYIKELQSRYLKLNSKNFEIKLNLVNSINNIIIKLKTEKLNRYQIIRLKAIKTKCNEILEMIDNDD